MSWFFSDSRGLEVKIVDSGAVKLGAGGPALPAQSLPLTKPQSPAVKGGSQEATPVTHPAQCSAVVSYL